MNTRTSSTQKITETKTSINYWNLIRSNVTTILTISLVIFGITLIYAITAKDVYKSDAVLRIKKAEGQNILDSPFGAALGNASTDRFIANEIEVMKNKTIREMVAQVLIDSFKTLQKTNEFNVILRQHSSLFSSQKPTLKSYKSLAATLLDKVDIKQKDGLDFVEIKAESSSPQEAALIANVYADVYRKFNLQDSRKQITKVKDFLAQQKDEIQSELMLAENDVKEYQLQNGSAVLDEQAKSLVNSYSSFKSEKDRIKIELSQSKAALIEYKKELAKRDPTLTPYLEGQAAEPTIKALQTEITSLEIQKNRALSSGVKNPALVNKYDTKINNLRLKLNQAISQYQSKVLAASPAEIKNLTKQVFQEQVKYETLSSSYYKINEVLKSYDKKFNTLPKKTLDLARLERKRQALEKLYLVLENKYQEALINEQSTPGNVLVMSAAEPSYAPAKPNRLLISILGLVLGFGIAFGFVFFKDYFDKTVKTPDDIENAGLNVIAWIPKFSKNYKRDNEPKNELFVQGFNEVAAGEAYRSLRTRIQFSKISEDAKTILVTSSAPQEGKTTVASNLAASFAQSGKKTLILDCDLRIPRIHSIFNGLNSPGFTNYLFKQASFNEIVRKTSIENLFYIAAGTIPTNPSEILASSHMKEFLQKLKHEYDIIVLDSPPIMTITDAEILTHLVDISILVVFATSTQLDWMLEAVGLMTKNGQKSFVGVVLNNFDYTATGYRSYNKYNHTKYYHRTEESKQKEWSKA